MKMPMTIVGTPASTFSTSRTSSATAGGANSVLKIAIRTPTGTAISVAMAVMISVPTIAFLMPPPVWPNGTGFFVKKSAFIAGRPLRATETTTIRSTIDREHRGGGGDELHDACRPASAAAPAASRS